MEALHPMKTVILPTRTLNQIKRAEIFHLMRIVLLQNQNLVWILYNRLLVIQVNNHLHALEIVHSVYTRVISYRFV